MPVHIFGGTRAMCVLTFISVATLPFLAMAQRLCYAPLCDVVMAYEVSDEAFAELIFPDDSSPLGKCLVARRALPSLPSPPSKETTHMDPWYSCALQQGYRSGGSNRYTHARPLPSVVVTARQELGGLLSVEEKMEAERGGQQSQGTEVEAVPAPTLFIGPPDGQQAFAFTRLASRPALDMWVGLASPPNGALVAGSDGVLISFRPNTAALRRSSYVMIDVTGVMKYRVELPNDYVQTQAVEPATWVVSVTPYTDGGVTGYVSKSFAEVVLTRDEIVHERRFWDVLGGSALQRVEMQQRLEHEPLKEPMHICVWGNDRMDGQKSIWFDQMAAMDPSEYTWTWVLAGTTAAAPGGSESDLDAGVDVDGVLRAVARDNPDGVVSNLIRMHRQQEKEGRTNIHVRFSPLESMALRYDVELEQRPVYANGTVGLSFNEAYRAHNLASRGGGAAAGAGSQRHSTLEYVPEMYMLDCWLEAKAAAGWVVGVDQSSQAQRLLDAIQPQWVRELYSGMAGFIRDEAACDVVVFGNNRGSTSDVLLVEAARLVGVPSVMELLCVFPEKHTLPDAVIAPSAYALEHSSLTHLVTLPTLQTAVIAPSVSPELLLQRPSDPLSLPDPNFFTVGLSGRVSPEKSPGLFLTMAHTLVATRADLASKLRFVIIGDGPLRAHLEDLVRWLGLEGRVKMVGWQDRAGLRHHLGRLDVLVAPALRAWSETFCIMNIEAMAMGVPVVTFGVGGQGEYVSGRPLEGYEAPSVPGAGLFTPTTNAVLVNEASPHALAMAVGWLHDHTTERAAIVAAARKTVRGSFAMDRQMREYRALYGALRRQHA